MAKGLNVVFQTHWDREWYLTFEQYRHRLVFVVKRVIEAIENKEIEYFVLDGQVAALEDLLEVCEDDFSQKLLNLIKENKIIIGPWYVLMDEFLVSGESLVRNLEIGMKLANHYGRAQKVGYLPDTFGHISQMPQLLQQFDIDNAIVWRGVSPRHSEFIWSAPSGCKVFTIFLPEGYYQPLLDQPDHVNHLMTYIEKVKPFSSTTSYLLTNGGDHLMPSRVNITKRQRLFMNESGEPLTITNFEQYLKDVKAQCNLADLDVISGELRGNEGCYLLPNVLSARSYLKVENQRLEDELTGYVEPLNMIASFYGATYPLKFIQESWKLLLKNHPHDSICGCSIDEVHQEMMSRNAILSQRLTVLQTGAFNQTEWMAYTQNDNVANHEIFSDFKKLTIFNPHPASFTGTIKTTIYLLSDSELNHGFALCDPSGQIIDVTILNQYKGRSFHSPTDYFPEFRSVIYYEIAFDVQALKGNSLTPFDLVLSNTSEELMEISGSEIENEYVLVKVNEDGTICLTDKIQQKVYQRVNQFYTSLDAGDEYNYSPPIVDCLTTATLKSIDCVKRSDLISTLTYTLELDSPKGLDSGRQKALDDRVKSTIVITLTLKRHQRTIDVAVNVNNQAKDQRLRVKLPLSTVIDYSYSDSAFDVVKRTANRLESFDAPRQKEVSVVVDPSLSFVSATSNNTGLVFYHRGLHEYQVINEEDQSVLEVTLIRSVGWLSRDDFRSRGGGAGPMLETPEAQMIGDFECEYGIKLSDPSDTLASIQAESRHRRIPPKVYCGSVGKDVISMFEINNKELAWSSIRKFEDSVEIRVYNPTEEVQHFVLESDHFSKINMTLLDGRVTRTYDVKQDIVMKPKCIQTLRLIR